MVSSSGFFRQEIGAKGSEACSGQPCPRPPRPKLSGTGRASLSVKTGRQNIADKRNCRWTLGWHKGVHEI